MSIDITTLGRLGTGLLQAIKGRLFFGNPPPATVDYTGYAESVITGRMLTSTLTGATATSVSGRSSTSTWREL